MVHTLIKAHKGIVGINSFPGQGSAFYIAIPKENNRITELDIRKIKNWAMKERKRFLVN